MMWRVTIEQDDEGNQVVPLPDELLAAMGVGIGDSLYLVEEYVGTTRCLVLSKTTQVPDRVDALIEHWNNENSNQLPQLHPPSNEAEYDSLAKMLDALLDIAGEDEGQPLKPLILHIADLIEAYDEALPRLP